jgi:hypothetical protein
MMGDAFSRRALYRHRARHMIAAESPAARRCRFLTMVVRLSASSGSSCEAELTAALAEERVDLSAKIKALHEISRLIWLELRAKGQGENDYVTAQYAEELDRDAQQAIARYEEARARWEAAPKGKAHDPSADT